MCPQSQGQAIDYAVTFNVNKNLSKGNQIRSKFVYLFIGTNINNNNRYIAYEYYLAIIDHFLRIIISILILIISIDL